jgi:alpha-1,2-mannosyltransferase
VEANETLAQAARRECIEEIGVAPDLLHRVPTGNLRVIVSNFEEIGARVRRPTDRSPIIGHTVKSVLKRSPYDYPRIVESCERNGQMWQLIKSGAWLTRERMHGYCLILLAVSLAASVIWIALADGLIDRNGKPIGTDFSNVWAAGKLVLNGEPQAPYDPVRQHAAEEEAFGGQQVPFYGWHYPPIFLLVGAGLALLPYAWALLAWMALTLPAYLWTLHTILPRKPTVLLALAFPAVFINLGHGQNGFLTAALLGGGLVLLDKKPMLAGVLIGSLAYKPQFAPLIPLVLLATGRWRVIAAAAATVLAACAFTLVLFGPQVWLAFADSTTFSRVVVLEAGDTGWPKIQSLFSAVRLWGGGIEVAYAAQTILTLALAASLVWLWRGSAAAELKAAALACACLLATPYLLDYDLVVLAVAIAFFARHGLAHGFRDYEITLLAFTWLAPLLARSLAGAIGLPLGLIAMLALYALILRRAFADLATNAQTSPSLVHS